MWWNNLVVNFNRNMGRVAVILDFNNAFDKVWNIGLRYKLAYFPFLHTAIHWLRSYLPGRTFSSLWTKCCRLWDQYAPPPLRDLVDLGSVLYLVFENDMTVVLEVTVSMYADVAMSRCLSCTQRKALDDNREADGRTLEWWRVTVNTHKNNGICPRRWNTGLNQIGSIINQFRGKTQLRTSEWL